MCAVRYCSSYNNNNNIVPTQVKFYGHAKELLCYWQTYIV